MTQHTFKRAEWVRWDSAKADWQKYEDDFDFEPNTNYPFRSFWRTSNKDDEVAIIEMRLYHSVPNLAELHPLCASVTHAITLPASGPVEAPKKEEAAAVTAVAVVAKSPAALDTPEAVETSTPLIQPLTINFNGSVMASFLPPVPAISAAPVMLFSVPVVYYAPYPEGFNVIWNTTRK